MPLGYTHIEFISGSSILCGRWYGAQQGATVACIIMAYGTSATVAIAF